MSFLRSLLFFGITCALPWPLVGQQKPLTRALDVRSLLYEHSLQALPVSLEGSVSFVESSGTVFIQDDSGGTHLHFRPPARHDLRVGDQIRVTGLTTPGLYFPGVNVESLTRMGHGSAPTAVPASYEDLASGRYHYQRIIAEGIGRSLTALEKDRSLLRLAIGAQVIEVRVDAAPEAAPALIDARIKITALAAGGINDRRQLVFPYLRVEDWTDITLATPAPIPESLPIQAVPTIYQFGVAAGPRHRVRIHGTVLAIFPDGRLYLRDAEPPPPPRTAALDSGPAALLTPPAPLPSPAIAVHLSQSTTALRIGTQVQVVGFPVMESFSASLADATVLQTHTEARELEPARLSLRNFQDGSHDGDLVTLEEEVLLEDLFRNASGHELRFTASGLSIRAVLPQEDTPALRVGSRCRLTGICVVEASATDRGFRSQPLQASLLLRQVKDIHLVAAAPFWDTQRLGIAMALLACGILMTTLWINLQRRQILRLRARISHQAALDERQRIAREFHDTLEQELAGLSLRLQAAASRPLEEKARALVDASRSLVGRIQAEARNLIADLRQQGRPASLPESLQSLAEQSREHFPQVTLDLHPIPELPPTTAHHLRMISREAVTNVIKHAAASTLTLHLSCSGPSEDQLILRISDDGRGFSPENGPDATRSGHFGCTGIRERCRTLGVQVQWESHLGQGTTLTLTLPLCGLPSSG